MLREDSREEKRSRERSHALMRERDIVTRTRAYVHLVSIRHDTFSSARTSSDRDEWSDERTCFRKTRRREMGSFIGYRSHGVTSGRVEGK